MKKSVIAVCTVAVVTAGVFLGVKLMAKPNTSKVQNTAMLQDKKTEEKKENDKSNFLSQNVDNDKASEEKKDNKETVTDEKDSKNTSDKNDKQTIKEEVNNKEDKKSLEDEKKDESKTTSGKEVEVYDDQYIVKKGDNLFTIGKQFFVKNNVTEGITLIKEINKLDDNSLIKVGDKLYIPTENNFESKKQEAKGQKSYEVKAGDTLTKIAETEMNWCDSQTGVKLLKETNKLQNDNIQKGQKIVIPTEMSK